MVQERTLKIIDPYIELPKSAAFFKMHRIADCMSPFSWMFLFIACHVPLLILFRPTFFEWLVYFFIDCILAFKINQIAEKKIFLKLYPEVAEYFDGLSREKAKAYTFEQKVALIESFFKFPLRRAIYGFTWGLVKVTPAILIVTFYWHHEYSRLGQFFLMSGVALVNLSYFFGGVLVNANVYLSDIMAVLYKQGGWSQAFETVNVDYNSKSVTLETILSLVSLFCFVLVLQGFVIFNSSHASIINITIKVLAVGFTGLMLFIHNFYLSRSFIIGGMENIFHTMANVDYHKQEVILPLHATPLLAKFEQTFNNLIHKVRSREQEIASLVLQQSEKQRFQTLGEITAYIAHDLKNPLHIIGFCADVIKNNPDKAKDEQYMNHLITNTNRAVELINAMRARFKNPISNREHSNFTECYNLVLPILKTQYYANQFDRVQFCLDSKLQGLELKLSQVDFIHIIDNLLRNSIENLLSNDIANPTIELTLQAEDEISASIVFQDNGTGLSKEQFEQMTSYDVINHASRTQMSMGLRLTRRMVELHGGELIVNSTNVPGTSFSLKLLKYEPIKNITIKVQEPNREGIEYANV